MIEKKRSGKNGGGGKMGKTQSSRNARLGEGLGGIGKKDNNFFRHEGQERSLGSNLCRRRNAKRKGSGGEKKVRDTSMMAKRSSASRGGVSRIRQGNERV